MSFRISDQVMALTIRVCKLTIDPPKEGFEMVAASTTYEEEDASLDSCGGVEHRKQVGDDDGREVTRLILADQVVYQEVGCAYVVKQH